MGRTDCVQMLRKREGREKKKEEKKKTFRVALIQHSVMAVFWHPWPFSINCS